MNSFVCMTVNETELYFDHVMTNLCVSQRVFNSVLEYLYTLLYQVL